MIHLADTVTKVGDKARGMVLVCGSHGGAYPGYLAGKTGARAVILNDAGGGKDNTGFASLDYLNGFGMAAATASNMSCRIGDAKDMMARGRISHTNDLSRRLGVEPGLSCEEAVRRLSLASLPQERGSGGFTEGRRQYPTKGARRIVLIDSASLVRPEDEGQIVITGSHGGLLGGNSFLALQVDGFAGVFHDAGIGIDDAGITRLPALDERGIAGITVDGQTARIGDALSVCEEGRISCVNETARGLGARPGERLLERLLIWSEDG
ncbi:hypothetical protein [Nitratireductor indicus]|uniref:hypothetical protein n=1 Tax=Nitratireductor indicus TaxID=721133 RepID=UPI00287686EF|nr:hypothetical protein [Nitratireductor indicus]MDS1135161.1 hypothetical protein [Nitratireductor indicus]